MKLIFIGSGDFSVPILEFLHKSYDVVLCISRPDRRSGRGKKIVRSVIGKTADELSIETFTPETINSHESISKMKNTEFDIAILASYSEILSSDVIQALKDKVINIHPSLLPKYRGAEPIRWTIRKGEKETGVTLMLVTEKLDRGQILAQEKHLISDQDDNQSLQEKLINLSKDMLPETILKVKNGFKGIDQPQEKLFYARRMKKKDEIIDWTKDAELISRKIRSMSPKPGCYTVFNDTRLKLFCPKVNVINTDKHTPGEIIKTEPLLEISCGKNSLQLSRIQREGKNQMDIKDFIKSGFFNVGDVFKSQLTL